MFDKIYIERGIKLNKKIALIIVLTFLLSFMTNCKKKTPCEKGEHTYVEISCDKPLTCSVCNATKGEVIGHNYVENPTTHLKTCSKCNNVTGMEYTLERNYTDINGKVTLYIKDYSISDFDLTYDDSIININGYGTIRGIEIGTTTVELVLKDDPSKSFSFEFEVLEVLPSVYSTYEKMTIGDSTTFYFKDNFFKIEDFDIVLQENSILTLEGNYVVANKYGVEDVTLVLKSNPLVKVKQTIKVINPNGELLIHSENNVGTMKTKETLTLTNSLGVDNTKLEWGTTNESIAVVSEYGIITAVSEGYVAIFAKDPNTNIITNFYLNIKGVGEADYISRLIHIALRENGTKEQGTNVQKYGAWYPNNGQPWCAMFVSWCWYQAGLTNDILLKYQGCYAGMKWCTEMGIMHFVQDYTFPEQLANGASSTQYAENYKPVAGDIIFFLSAGMGHTGIAIHSDDNYLYTIEGNTSDQVAIKRWSLNDARITGYAHPKYPEYSGEREDFSWIATKKVNGSYMWTNVSEQQKVD